MKKGGKRVYYPMEPEPYKEGIRINSPHYLVKLVDDTSLTYTLAICQYQKSKDIYYTLRVFATQPFQINELTEPYIPKYSKRIQGEWKETTAGGCSNYQDTFKNNPVYQIILSSSKDSNSNHIKIELKGPQY